METNARSAKISLNSTTRKNGGVGLPLKDTDTVNMKNRKKRDEFNYTRL